MSPTPRTRVLLLTGMSGAGKSTAIKILEDLGYEGVGNIPLSLLAGLFVPADGGAGRSRHDALAVDIDIRTRDFTAARFLARLEPLLARDDLDVRLIFLDCDDDVLAKRYTETRRRHPLAEDRPLMDGIISERAVIGPLRARAGLVIDTTQSAIPDLRGILTGHFHLDAGPALSITVTSFAFRHGLPREADLVFDVRFLANPHYEEKLRPLTGRDAAVAAYVATDSAFAPFFERLAEMVIELLPYYEREGKTYLTIAVGCTGGRHRSVLVAERLGVLVREAGHRAEVRHRDIDTQAP